MNTFLKKTILRIACLSMLSPFFLASNRAIANDVIHTNLLLHLNMALYLKDYPYVAKLYGEFTDDMKNFKNLNFDRIIAISLYVGNPQSAFVLAKTAQDTSDLAKLVLAIENIKQQKFNVASTLLNDQDPGQLGIKYVLNRYTKNTKQMDIIQQKIPEFANLLDMESVANTVELNSVIAQLLRDGNPKNIPFLQLALYLSPNDINTKYNLLIAYTQDYNEYMVGKIAATIPQNEQTDYLMQQVYETLESPDAKDTVLGKIRLKTPYWHMAIAHSLIVKSAYAQAEKNLLQANKDGALNDSWSYWYKLGRVYERQKNIPKAQSAFNKAIPLSNYDPEIVNYLAYTEIINGIDVENNLKKLKQAYEKSPTPYIADSVGWAYYTIKQYKNALRYLEIAVQTMPMNGVINDHLGDTYYALGRHREAVIHWQRALMDTEEKDLNRPLVKQKIKGLQ